MIWFTYFKNSVYFSYIDFLFGIHFVYTDVFGINQKQTKSHNLEKKNTRIKIIHRYCISFLILFYFCLTFLYTWILERVVHLGSNPSLINVSLKMTDKVLCQIFYCFTCMLTRDVFFVLYVCLVVLL